MKLSTPSVLESSHNSATAFTTNILVIGGSYAGLSAIVGLKNLLRQKLTDNVRGRIFEESVPPKVSVTLIEPRAGFLNILGIPRCMVDTEFAPSQWLPFHELNDVFFDKIVSSDEGVLEDFRNSKNRSTNEAYGFTINYVHGKVTYVDDKKAQYALNDDPKDKAIIDFDYMIFGTGRDRKWPVNPQAFNKSYFLEEMEKFNNEVAANSIISIIGAGAVGIEVAGDIKMKYPEKTVNLIHPHPLFPPEPLKDEFKEVTHDSLHRAGVKIIINTRIARVLPNGDLETTEGKTIRSKMNFWCNAHRNNTAILSTSYRNAFIADNNNISVNTYLQMYNPTTGEKSENVFCIGDMVDLPLIKSAGWAMYMGRQVANNLVHMIVEGKFVEPFYDYTTMKLGMVLVAGNEDIVSELEEEVELNNAGCKSDYVDYCMERIRASLTC